MNPIVIGDSSEASNNSDVPVETELRMETYFPTNIYTVIKPEFVNVVSKISNELLEISREKSKIDEIYPVVMTENFFGHPDLQDFCSFVGNTAWNLLNSEGYNMDRYVLQFSEMWVQEHHKHSLMETHVHEFGSQISGFYFLETPENCSRVVIHDPRPGKIQINLMERDGQNATNASRMINFLPKPGMLLFAPSWLPHSFSRHAADSPLKFVHFNLVSSMKPDQVQVCNSQQAEIV